MDSIQCTGRMKESGLSVRALDKAREIPKFGAITLVFVAVIEIIFADDKAASIEEIPDE